MRYLTFVWAIIILLLACVPCTDSGTAAAQEKQDLCQADHDPDNPEHADDLCSPLCECKCCGGIVLVAVTQQTAAPQLLPEVLYRDKYVSSDICSPAFSLWHPPKA